MSERSHDTIWHDEVEVGKTRRIAARGLTPNHIHDRVRVRVDDVVGILADFQHDSGYTVISIITDRNQFIEMTAIYLTEIEVTVP